MDQHEMHRATLANFKRAAEVRERLAKEAETQAAFDAYKASLPLKVAPSKDLSGIIIIAVFAFSIGALIALSGHYRPTEGDGDDTYRCEQRYSNC